MSKEPLRAYIENDRLIVEDINGNTYKCDQVYTRMIRKAFYDEFIQEIENGNIMPFVPRKEEE